MEHREVTPIVSGSTKYGGLTLYEWNIAGFVFVIGFIIPMGMILKTIFILVWAAAIFVWGNVLKNMEENILEVIIENSKIPPIVVGIFRKPIPIDKPRSREVKENING